MGEEKPGKLNQLQRKLPEGLLVDAGWLESQGYYGSLRKKYVDSGWLVQPARGVFTRPREKLRWEQVVISFQTLLELPVHVGGRTALEMQGYSHYLAREQREVHLYGARKPPAWLDKLPLDVAFVFHQTRRLFRHDPIARGLPHQKLNIETGHGTSRDPLQVGGLRETSWGQWDWPMTLSTPERAVLELLDELPDNESFHQVDKLMEGLATLSPRRLQKLLEDCGSVKVKRLFFFFADRHRPRWLNWLDRDRIDLGSGKRMLVRGGKLDPTYEITVPADLDAVR